MAGNSFLVLVVTSLTASALNQVFLLPTLPEQVCLGRDSDAVGGRS